MEWTQDFESGLTDIDVQHRQLFALIQRVNEIDERNNRGDIRDVIEKLMRFTRYHFDCEERLMVESDYPDSANHTAEHAKLLLEVQRYQDNTVFSPEQLARVLCNWLISHTLMDDRPLAQHVLQRRPAQTGSTQ